MSVAGLRRAGFAATVAVALLMLVFAFHGMTRVDTTLQIVSAAPPERPVYVLDAREPRWHHHRAVRDCHAPRDPRSRIWVH